MKVKVRKKGKTRGRPSKAEKALSAILSWQMTKNEPEIMKAHWDMQMLGTGVLKMFNNGKMKRVKLPNKKFEQTSHAR